MAYAIKSNVVIHITNTNNSTTTFTTSSSTTNNNNNNNNNSSATSLATSMYDLRNQSNRIANGIIYIRIPSNL